MILSKTYQDIPSDNQIWQRKIPDQNLSLHRKKHVQMMVFEFPRLIAGWYTLI
jgi:hypothetical protein